jgi:hypothetical protein
MKKILFVIFLLCAAPAWGATYYVNPSVVSSGDCLHDSTGCKTIAEGLAKLTVAGDDLYIKCGGTWQSIKSTDYYSIPVSGVNAGNPTVIGAYYMVGDTETPGVPQGGQKPVLHGNDVAPAYGTNYGLITIASKDYVTLQDLKIYKSQNTGILVNGTSDHVIIDRCDLVDIQASGISLTGTGNTVNTCTIQYCDISYTDMNTKELNTNYGGGIQMMQGAYSNTVQYNTVHNCYGEGIDAGKGAYSNIITNNTVYATRSVMIYIGEGAHDNTVKNNLTYCTTNTDFWKPRNPAKPGIGISVADEYYTGNDVGENTKNNLVYNNVVAGCGWGIDNFPDAVNNKPFESNNFYNNTIIDCWINVNFQNVADSYYTGTSNLKNNLFLCVTEGCVHYSGPTTMTNVVWDYNLWGGGTAPTGEAAGAHDQTSAPTLVKMTGYRALADGELSLSDVKFTSAASVGVDDGADTSATVTTDAFGTTRPVNTVVDIGAHEWPVTETPVCGDTYCDPAEENCTTCEADCGACAATFSCTDVGFLWDAETTTINYTLGATGTVTLNGATLETTQKKQGSKSLYCPTSEDYASVVLADNLVINPQEGSIGVWFYLNSAPVSGATLVYAKTTDGTGLIYISLLSTGDVRINIYANSTYYSQSTSAAGLTTGAWYYAIAKWDQPNKDMSIAVYNATLVQLAKTENTNYTFMVTSSSNPYTLLKIGPYWTASSCYIDYVGISKQYETDWLDIAGDVSIYDCTDEDPVSLALTEIAVPVVPLAGAPTWTLHSTLAGTLTMSGPCKTDTTTIIGGNNNITFYTMGKGNYSNCIASITDSGDNTETLNVSPFTVDFWTLDFSPSE